MSQLNNTFTREELLAANAEREDAEAADYLVQRAGGPEVWSGMMNHANQHWSPEYRDSFAEAITGNDKERAKRAVDYLRTDFAKSLGQRMPKLGL